MRQMSSKYPSKYQDFWFCFALVATVFLFFHEILSLHTGFYSGDHRQQHYPWAYYYWEFLKQGKLPWWTSAFQAGFPVLAEGQVGALYPLNFLFYKFFPFDFAYTYGILANYSLGAVFFYLLVRHWKVSPWAAFLGGMIFLYGTAQGGYYYNIISLKTLIWFPLTLLLICRYLDERGLKAFVLLPVIFAIQFFAGYLQYAVYSVFFASLFYVVRVFEDFWVEKNTQLLLKRLLAYTAVGLTAILIALPQLGATLELSSFSRRFDYPLEFAFVLSVNPLALATLFFPHWDGLLRAEVYFSSLGLLFLILSMGSKKSRYEKYMWGGLILAFLCALGKFNPLYVLAVKLTGFSSFRVPAKFLYFCGFFGAVVCAFGIEKFLKGGLKRVHEGFWLILHAVAILGVVLTYAFLKLFRDPLTTFFQGYMDKHFSNSPIRPHSMETYYEKLENFYDAALQMTSFLDVHNLGFILFMVLTFLLIFWVPRKHKWYIAFVAMLIFYNLYFYGTTSVKGNLEPREFLEKPSKITDYLKANQFDGRTHRAFKTIQSADEMLLTPHYHLKQHIAITGAYAPLMMKDYFEYLEDLGDVNDSQTLAVSNKEKFFAAKDKLNYLNAGFILSDHKFSFDTFPLIMEEGGQYLYDNPYDLGRIYGLDEEGKVHKVSILKLSDYGSRIEATLNVPDKVKELVVADVYYPGWKAALDGAGVSISKYQNLLKKFPVKAGRGIQLEMTYEPLWEKFVPLTMVLSFLLVGLFGFLCRRRK